MFHVSFSKTDRILWLGSVFCVLFSFLLFDRSGLLTLTASLIGVTSLIFSSKGNPLGQALMIVFSILYGIISFSFSYYGEMITYLGMTMPMAVFSLISWLRNPFGAQHAEVAVEQLPSSEIPLLILITGIVTALFAWILYIFHTANLILSPVSVATSFLAAYLTFRRSPLFALAYAANDVILILLWILASMEDRSYLSVVVCFVIFLINDLYGFISWKNMERRQSAALQYA